MADGAKRIILVGHCVADAFALRAALRSLAPGATVEFATSGEKLMAELPRADLLLVNRVLDGDFPAESGVGLIRSLAGARAGDRPPAMLVSNVPEAQAEARAAGALPGFGKTDMYSEQARRRVREALGIAHEQARAADAQDPHA